MLPASPSEHYSGAGGLLRMCIDLAFYSLQSAEGRVFQAAGVEERHRLEARWKYAVFLAGLTTELHRLGWMVVTDVHGVLWPSYTTNLVKWLDQRKVQEYFLSWNGYTPSTQLANGPSTSHAGAYLNAVIPTEAIEYLQDGSPEIVRVLYGVTSGSIPPRDHQASAIVNEIRQKVLERDLQQRPSRYGKLVSGSHLEPHLLDACRTLYESNIWTVNERDAKLWHTQEGLFLVWPRSAKNILEVLERRGLTGIPRSSSTIAEIMVRSGIAKAQDEFNLYWNLNIGNGQELAIKFANPVAVMGMEVPQPLAASIVTPSPKPFASSSTSTRSAMTPTQQVSEAAKIVQRDPDPRQRSLLDGLDAETDKDDKSAQEVDVTKKNTPRRARATSEITANAEQLGSDFPSNELNDTVHASTIPKSEKTSMSSGGVPTGLEKPSSRTMVEGQPTATEAQDSSIPESHNSILVPSEAKTFSQYIPEKVRPLFRDPLREIVGHLVYDFNHGNAKQAMRLTDEGFAVSFEYLDSFGVPADKIVLDLDSLSFLYRNPKRPGLKVHNVKMLERAKALQCMIIALDAGLGLGLIPGAA
jgi:conjugal transfer pilus assembly protein TraI